MLSAPPLLPHHPPPQLAAPSSSASTCVRAGDAAEEDVAGGEDGTSNDVFASLMPNLFSRLKHCDETVSEQEFEEIHRLLNVARSEDDGINGKSLVTQSTVHKAQEEMENTSLLSKQHEKAQEGVRGKRSPRMKADYAHGKENASPNNPPQRNKLSRRERSSRITTHRKPFVVDTRSFGSILNDNALGKCQKPQDVHAFWEAADEREASEAIMGKLRGRCEQNGTTSLRRLGLRRKNSQRTTTRLKRFAVELPSGSEQVQSLDQEKLEEEDDAIEESSFTFLSNPEFRDLKQLFEQKIAKNQIQGSKLSSHLYSVQKGMEITYLNGVINEPEEDCEVLSDGKSPLVKCSVDLPNATASTDEAPEFRKQSQAADMVDVAPNENAADFIISVAASQDTNVTENCNAASQPEMKATPYNRNMGAKRTPFTSPTPPSNPLAAFGLRKETALEDMSKRRLDFEDTADLAASHLDLPAPVTQDAPCLQISSSSPGGPEASMKEATPEPARESLPEASASLEAPNSVEQIEMKPPQKAFNKRKKPIENRRNSLEGAGTDWNEGRRYSTRIKSRPLEWWRGERFLRGRVHKSLVTVIGIKYSSPPPCWSKRGTKAPEFKVESYVSEDYAKYVQFAALC